MIKGIDIVVVGIQPWDIEIGSNCKNIAMEFALHNRVLYVNPPLDRITAFRKSKDEKVKSRLSIIRGKHDDLTLISPNLWNLTPRILAESVNWIPVAPAFRLFNHINNKRLAFSINAATKRLGFSKFVLFNDQSMIRCYHLKEMIKPELFVYYIRDNLSTIPYFKKYALKMQEEMIAQADVVATNSESLANYARKFNPQSSMVGQGCDFNLYVNTKELAIADELKNIASPIIGYTGFLTSLRLDINLLEHIAIQRPHWNLVFVGPEDEDFRNSRLHQLPNVHFTGNISPEELPAYIKGFNVAFNPQLINDLTSGNYPRKIDEYLAMGKPTVATATPFMDYFKEHTYLAENKIEYVRQIEKALAENNFEKEVQRRSFALTHNWDKNVEAIYDLIHKSSNTKQELN